MNEQTQEKIAKLQSLEQNLNSILMQKQQFQSQIIEIDNALEQIKTSNKVFRILGNIMVLSDKKNVENYLNEKKEIVQLRLKTLEKQETKVRDQASQIHEEVLKEMKRSGKNG